MNVKYADTKREDPSLLCIECVAYQLNKRIAVDIYIQSTILLTLERKL